jgi:hypothetical protein
MKIIIVTRRISELRLGLSLGLLTVLGWYVGYFFKDGFSTLPPCLFRVIVGIPCPACGASRAGIALSHLNIFQGFLSNPLFFIIFTGMALMGGNALVGLVWGKNLSIALSEPEQKWLRIILLLSLPVNWGYLIVHHLLSQ